MMACAIRILAPTRALFPVSFYKFLTSWIVAAVLKQEWNQVPLV